MQMCTLLVSLPPWANNPVSIPATGPFAAAGRIRPAAAV